MRNCPGEIFRVLAIRGIWKFAAAGEISGSMPDEDAVTKSIVQACRDFPPVI